jgi:hypothetical protein
MGQSDVDLTSSNSESTQSRIMGQSHVDLTSSNYEST